MWILGSYLSNENFFVLVVIYAVYALTYLFYAFSYIFIESYVDYKFLTQKIKYTVATASV